MSIRNIRSIPRKPIHRQCNVHIGSCRQCGQCVQGRHSVQTSDALGAAASQLATDAQAAVVELNKQACLSHGKVQRLFDSLFGISLSCGGIAHVVRRAARRCEAVYAGICQSAWVVPDPVTCHAKPRSPDAFPVAIALILCPRPTTFRLTFV